MVVRRVEQQLAGVAETMPMQMQMQLPNGEVRQGRRLNDESVWFNPSLMGSVTRSFSPLTMSCLVPLLRCHWLGTLRLVRMWSQSQFG